MVTIQLMFTRYGKHLWKPMLGYFVVYGAVIAGIRFGAFWFFGVESLGSITGYAVNLAAFYPVMMVISKIPQKLNNNAFMEGLGFNVRLKFHEIFRYFPTSYALLLQKHYSKDVIVDALVMVVNRNEREVIEVIEPDGIESQYYEFSYPKRGKWILLREFLPLRDRPLRVLLILVGVDVKTVYLMRRKTLLKCFQAVFIEQVDPATIKQMLDNDIDPALMGSLK